MSQCLTVITTTMSDVAHTLSTIADLLNAGIISEEDARMYQRNALRAGVRCRSLLSPAPLTPLFAGRGDPRTPQRFHILLFLFE